MQTSAYADDGVNISLGDRFSAAAGEVCRSTFKGSRFVRVHDFAKDGFRGPRGLRFRNLPDGYYLDTPADGVGTKVGIITEAMSHRTAGRDLVAMTASDVSRYGGVPLAIANVLDVSSLGEDKNSETYKQMIELVEGLGMACRAMGIVLMRGETAELGPFVGSENPKAMTKFNWSGFVLGAYHPRRVITGEAMAPGDVVVSLREYGFRSNGLSSVRKAFANKFGERWWANSVAEPYIRMAAQPSMLYDKLLARLNGWYDERFRPPVKLKAIAHISGGGIPGKFGEDLLFPQGLSAELDNLWPVPDIMERCYKWRSSMTEEEAYRTWNGGQGMLLVVRPKDVITVTGYAHAAELEAKEVGRIFKSADPVLDIKSGYSGNQIRFWPSK